MMPGPNRPKSPGIIEFFERFPNEEACLDHIAMQKWGETQICPECGEIGGLKKLKGAKKWWHSCRKQFSTCKDTIFYRSNVSVLAWFYAIFLFANSSMGMRTPFIRKQLGLGHRGAIRVCELIRLHMASMPRPEALGGPGILVHVDEVHLRRLISESGGPHEAAIVLGIASQGRVMCGIVPDRKASTIIPALLARIRPGSTVVTDMHLAYSSLQRHGYRHLRINHSVAFHDFNGQTNNDIEAFWATVRRSFRSYRQVSKSNLWAYLAEIEYRYNFRHSKHLIFEDLISHFPNGILDEETQYKGRYYWI
ncbi:IS1595 family transposase [Porphyrobacter sp. YT40]|uniref:IS1595 family transposase n=1 Tax=Porphyrobacter sp. YT40 TaxID=2547601 RepID=UPI001143E03A|nr:IS1595 family transposase [Porphyrobacter sp. YT40]QDH33849.1 IS1595 family transposase [Porphyrobacter sp. YT40]